MIEIKNLQKVINQHTVLDIPDLTVASGEIAAVTGAEGSGLDVLLRILTGRLSPSLGEVSLVGINPMTDSQSFSHRVGVMFAEDGLYERQTPQRNLSFYCRLYGVPTSRADEVLRQIGLVDQKNLLINKLSSGLKRRLVFGRAILHSPQVLILVEPFNRCDEGSLSLIDRFTRQAAEEGRTVLILAGDSAHLNSLCDVIYQLEKGKIVESVRPKDLQQNSLPFKIPIRLEGKVILLNPADILYADTVDGKTYLCTAADHLPTQFTLSELETRLVPSGFFRAHRSFLVNLQHVKEVIPYTRNSFSLRLDDSEETLVPLSKQAASELKILLGF